MATVLKNPGPIEFEDLINQNSGGGRWVRFPYDLKETYGKGNLVPVIVTFDGKVKYRGSLANMGGESTIILIRKDIAAQIGKQGGDWVKVLVELDTSERKINLAKDAEEALKAAGLLDKFKALAFTHQREYHQWIESAKRLETRAGRIEKMVRMLESNIKNSS